MDQMLPPVRLRFGPFVADFQACELRKYGTRIRLQEKPMLLLAALTAKPGEVVSREELQKQLWPSDTFVDFETGLNSAVRKLREALADHPERPRYVETIPKRGYRFLAEVHSNGVTGNLPPAVVTRSSSALNQSATSSLASALIGTTRRIWMVVASVLRSKLTH